MISPYASPGSYGWHSRTFIMSKYLANRGHDVTVFSFTGSHYLLLKKGSEITNQEETHDGVKFRWFHSVQWQNQRLPIRIINWWIYNRQLKQYLNTYSGKAPDAVVFSIPALHQVRLMPLTKKRFPKARLIFEIQDIWPLSVEKLGTFSANNFIIKRLKQAEGIAFEYAQEVIAVQPGIGAYVAKEYPLFPQEKVHFIPHAYVPEVIDKKEVTFDIGYAGTLSRANDLDTLINALYLLKSRYGYEPKVLVLGTGSKAKALKKQANSLKNVVFKAWTPREQTLQMLSACRICYDGFLAIDLYDFGFSRLKWVDYMMLGKPILAAYSGNAIDVDIEEIGWQVPAQDVEKLAETIYSVCKQGLVDEMEKKGKRAFNFLRQNRHIDVLGPVYEQLLLG